MKQSRIIRLIFRWINIKLYPVTSKVVVIIYVDAFAEIPHI